MSRNLGRLISASAASNLADGAFGLALPLVALSVTRSPAAFASVTVVSRLPWLMFALPAGALADRLDRRRTMTAVNVARALVIGALAVAVATERADLWMLYTVGFCLGVGETLFDTAAQSLLPTIVPPEGLDRANGRLYAVEMTANQFIGPPLAAIVAGATLAGAVAGASALYLVAGIALMTMTGSFRASRPDSPATIRRDIGEGVRYLARHRLLRTLAVCVGVSNLASTAMISVLPLYMIAPGPIGLHETGYGLVITCIAIGSVVGTTIVQRVRTFLGTRRTLILATMSFPLFSLTPVVTHSVALIAIGFFVAGGVSVGWNIITVSIRQRIVPNHLLGRVNAGYRLVAWGTMPIGAALGGALASLFGITSALITAALISSACAPIVYFGATDKRLAAADRPESDAVDEIGAAESSSSADEVAN